MKTALPWIIVAILILVVIYFYTKKPAAIAPTLSTSPSNNLYDLGLSLANLIGSTKCGKNGNPPCTTEDLHNAGWTPEQIAAAQAGSTTVQNTLLCTQYGIGC